MCRSLVAVVVLSAWALSCCKGDHPKPKQAPQELPSAKAQQEPPSAEVPQEGSAESAGPADLPQLKPVIPKPFPDGATEEQVCEAIEDTDEKDLWVRFGHLIPMHVFGSVFVLEAPGHSPDDIRAFIRDHHFGFDARSRFCDDSRALVYIRGMPEQYEKDGHIEGRKVLVDQLQEGLQVKVSESFAFPDDQDRLSDYCRVDADLCEALVKLDRANQGKGLCSRAVSSARIGDVETNTLMSRCAKVPRKVLACTEFAFEGSEANYCRHAIREALRKAK